MMACFPERTASAGRLSSEPGSPLILRDLLDQATCKHLVERAIREGAPARGLDFLHAPAALRFSPLAHDGSLRLLLDDLGLRLAREALRATGFAAFSYDPWCAVTAAPGNRQLYRAAKRSSKATLTCRIALSGSVDCCFPDLAGMSLECTPGDAMFFPDASLCEETAPLEEQSISLITVLRQNR